MTILNVFYSHVHKGFEGWAMVRTRSKFDGCSSTQGTNMTTLQRHISVCLLYGSVSNCQFFDTWWRQDTKKYERQSFAFHRLSMTRSIVLRRSTFSLFATALTV